jgi:ribonuclease BN (tRNA processing enzyme)
MQDRLDLTVREVDEGSFSLAGFDVAAMDVRHSMRCLAYRFAAGEVSDGGTESWPVAFSGDTEAFPGLVEFADGAAVLVHDCSFPDDVDVSNHPTPSQLGAALSGIEVGTVSTLKGCLNLETEHVEAGTSTRAPSATDPSPTTGPGNHTTCDSRIRRTTRGRRDWC